MLFDSFLEDEESSELKRKNQPRSASGSSLVFESFLDEEAKESGVENVTTEDMLDSGSDLDMDWI